MNYGIHSFKHERMDGTVKYTFLNCEEKCDAI